MVSKRKRTASDVARGERLAALREARKLTQTQAAELATKALAELGVMSRRTGRPVTITQPAIAKIEEGWDRFQTDRVVIGLAKAYDLDPGVLRSYAIGAARLQAPPVQPTPADNGLISLNAEAVILDALASGVITADMAASARVRVAQLGKLNRGSATDAEKAIVDTLHGVAKWRRLLPGNHKSED